MHIPKVRAAYAELNQLRRFPDISLKSKDHVYDYPVLCSVVRSQEIQFEC